MGVEEISNAILKDAKDEAEKIKVQVKKRKEEIVQAAKSTAEKIKEEGKRKTELEAESKKDRMIGIAQLEARKAILATKYQLVEDAIKSALNKLKGMSDEEYLKIIESRFLALDIPNGQAEVFISAQDKNRITLKWLKKIETQLAKQGKKVSLNLSNDTKNIAGGFILKVGGFEINNSFEAWMKVKRDEIEKEVVKILFGEK